MTVFGTLKFSDGTMLSDAVGNKYIRRFFGALDRAYYGNAANNAGMMRHRRLVFRHRGICGTNLHYHFLAKPASCPIAFADLARRQWACMGGWTTNYDDTQIEQARDVKATSTYVAHEFERLGADCICLSASHLKPPAQSHSSYRGMPQLRRLLKLQNSQ